MKLVGLSGLAVSGKIALIFKDREKTSISPREGMIVSKGKTSRNDLEKLIESLAGVKAAPIRVIKNNL